MQEEGSFCFQFELSNNIKAPLFEIGAVGTNVCKHSFSEFVTHLLINHTQNIFTLPRKAILDRFSYLMLNPDRHVNVHPVLEFAGAIEDLVETTFKLYDVITDFIGEFALLRNVKLVGLDFVSFCENHINLRTNLI